MKFESKQLQDFNRQSELKCWFASFKFREKPNADSGHSRGILQGQPCFFSTLPQDRAQFFRVTDFLHRMSD